MMTSIKILKEPESALLVGPGGPSVGIGKALLTCCSEDSPRQHPPGPPQTVTDAATGRGTEPPGVDRETDPPGADRETDPPRANRETNRARRSGQNVVDMPESTCRAEAAHGWARGQKCALHSTVYKGQGGALGEEGAHMGVQPLPTPQLRVPASPACAGDVGFTEDSGPPTPPSGWVRDSLSSLRPPPASTQDPPEEAPLQGSQGTTSHLLQGPPRLHPQTPRPTCPPRSAKPNTWAKSPSHVTCQQPTSSPGSRLREVK